jgi:hypothetical protein
MTIASTVAAVATAVDTVSGLRVQTNLGKVNATPAAVVECDSAQGPSSFDGARDYVIRVALCVQVGEYRDSVDRIYALAESVVDAIEAAGLLGPWRFEMGTLDFGGQHYGGGVLAVQVVE